ncbi:hypothetical protein LAZ40_04915 [Cereibacter sphaeroides]|uniref:hypothetical protein n=1 Tax=Cereibacter sphaeroides TaxID=1063 RepID=UPI001F1CFFC1|nr:hypothetical protein [Cereibacter sphaeroides]MCE6958397.1 hypothetical protein [Cereibacter sphaeroides]MCE6972264.1 hypothetical protein [Cereibacter sphaeroides]
MYAKPLSLDETLAVTPVPRKSRVAPAPLRKTGPFLHQEDHARVVRFDAGDGTRRSFTVLATPGRSSEPRSARGSIAVLDNDSGEIVVEGHVAGGSRKVAVAEQVELVERIAGMGWDDFRTFCQESPGFRALSEKSIDNRDDFLRSFDGVSDYSFPRRTREGMIRDIMSHGCSPCRDGKMRFSWDIRMNFVWDRSGRVQDGEDLCPSQDARWREALEEDRTLYRRACETALADYVDAPFRVLDDDDMLCDLEVIGVQGGWVILNSIGGKPIAAPTPGAMRQLLEGSCDVTVRNLWTALRTLDVDFSRKNRTFEMQWALNGLRAELEAEWLEELDPELMF